MVSVPWTQPAGGYLANATFPAVTLEFAYDGLSRRVQKKTIKNGTAEMEGYVYDGWNVVMISKLDPTNQALPVRKWSCVWRPDIGSRLYARGSWQAAGGVGGLAWLQTGIAQTVYPYYTYSQVTGNGEVHIPMMDHMGNVRHYYQIKTTANYSNPATVTGQITANLDYDAFGREVRATSPKTPAKEHRVAPVTGARRMPQAIRPGGRRSAGGGGSLRWRREWCREARRGRGQIAF